jgi:hypothetical protein
LGGDQCCGNAHACSFVLFSSHCCGQVSVTCSLVHANLTSSCATRCWDHSSGIHCDGSSLSRGHASWRPHDRECCLSRRSPTFRCSTAATAHLFSPRLSLSLPCCTPWLLCPRSFCLSPRTLPFSRFPSCSLWPALLRCLGPSHDRECFRPCHLLIRIALALRPHRCPSIR